MKGIEQVYTEKWNIMVATARRLVPDPADAEDIVQEAWLILMKGWVGMHQTYKALRWAAKEHRTRLYGRDRRNRPTRTFIYWQGSETAMDTLERFLQQPEAPSPAQQHAQRLTKNRLDLRQQRRHTNPNVAA